MKLQLLLEEDIVDGDVSVYYAEELLLVASWCAVCWFGGWAVRERTKNKMAFRTKSRHAQFETNCNSSIRDKTYRRRKTHHHDARTTTTRL